ncbi:MAG TPA: hypothetical protein VJ385_06320 [Fibrobacteria bacterium]|nr:hypothetical protein [Fibrobacteria bacterium]
MHRTLARAALLTALVSAYALTGCLSDSSGETATPSLAASGTTPYSVSGEWILNPAHDDTGFYCSGNTLDSEVYENGADSVRFKIAGEKLSIYHSSDTARSGAVVEWISVYTRSGAGSGLEGTWTATDEGYQVVSGTLTAAEKTEHDSDLMWSKHYSSYKTVSVRFANGIITSSFDLNTAALFMERWNGIAPGQVDQPDSAQFDMTARAVDKYTVEFKGRKTGETVRVTTSPIDDKTYVSDQSAHAIHRYYGKPKTCPNEVEPLWYREFQTGNSKPAEAVRKSGQIGLKSVFPRNFLPFPLKPPYSLLN